MAFKTWSAGDVLTASDVNTYLGQQSVIVCTSGTRPSSPVEGMTVYETDTDMLRSYTGSAWQWTPGLKPHVLLAKTTASVANNTMTTINWTSEVKDVGNMWSAGSSSLITIPYDGVYRVELIVRWASQTTAAGLRVARIDVGGVEQMTFYLPTTSALNATNVITPLSYVMQMTAAEQIECKVYQNSGGALDIISNTRVLVEMISEG